MHYREEAAVASGLGAFAAEEYLLVFVTDCAKYVWIRIRCSSFDSMCFNSLLRGETVWRCGILSKFFDCLLLSYDIGTSAFCG